MRSGSTEASRVAGPKVFISYRRSDTDDIAEKLGSLLKGDLGSRNVYRDRESLILGQPWREALRDAIHEADAALFLVGPGWEGDGASGRRIDEATDVVRREAVEALTPDVRANPLPLLIDRAVAPQDLPSDVAGLFDQPHFLSMSRDEVTSGTSAGYQSILVGVWAALARLVPRGVVVLGESSRMVELDSLVEELTDAGALDAHTLSRFASGVYIASWRDAKRISSDFPQLIVRSTGEPSEILKARLSAFATLWPGAAAAVTGAGAAALVGMGPSLGFGGSTGAATLVQASSAQLGLAPIGASTASSTGGVAGMWASASMAAKVATAVAGVAIVAGGAAVLSSALAGGDSPDVASKTLTDLEVSGAASIYQAGVGATSSEGIDPPQEGFAPPSVPVDGGDVVNIEASGAVYFADDGEPSPGPDGDPSWRSRLSDLDGISGFSFPASMPLVGVFLDGANRASEAPLPRQDSGNEVEVTPVLGQVFFIGDGFGSGRRTDFIVPGGATSLYLGTADGWDVMGRPGYYHDNSGSYEVSISIRPPD